MTERHDVQWHGVFRGTDEDPREVGYCLTCSREVYDGEGPHTTRRAPEWRALSLTQPWAWIILNLGKRIENRPRNIGNYRGPLLLHAAKRMRLDDWMAAYRFVEERFGRETASRIPDFALANTERQALGWGPLPLGAIVGRCNVVDQCRPGDTFGLVMEDQIEREQERWYMGAHAYGLAGVQPTKVVPCLGALGFWRPPTRVLAELGLEAARG